MYTLYIVQCADRTLYTGITTDLKRRIAEHDAGTGAKYTRGKGPVRLLYFRRFRTRSRASIEEARIKGWSRQQKLIFVERHRSGSR